MISLVIVEFISYNTVIDDNGIGLKNFNVNYVIVICFVMYIFLQSMLEFISKKQLELKQNIS